MLAALIFSGVNAIDTRFFVLVHWVPAVNDSNRFHGSRRHLGWGEGGGGRVAAKVAANVWEIVQLSSLVTSQLYLEF